MSLADNVAIIKRLEQLEGRLTGHLDLVSRHFNQLETNCTALDSQLHSIVKQLEAKRSVNCGSEVISSPVVKTCVVKDEMEVKTREDVARFITQMNLGTMTGRSAKSYDYTSEPISNVMELEIESSETSKIISIDSMLEVDVIVSEEDVSDRQPVLFVSTPSQVTSTTASITASEDDLTCTALQDESIDQLTTDVDHKLRVR